MKRFEHRQQIHAGKNSRMHTLPLPPMPVSLPAALALASLQLGVPELGQALCHVVTEYGHGVCSFQEAFAATSDTYQTTPNPLPSYFYQTVPVVVSGGLLSPPGSGNMASGKSSDKSSAAADAFSASDLGNKCAFIAAMDTMAYSRNPFKSPVADLASGLVHTGEHPFLIIVPRGSYEALYREMKTPQRVQPRFRDGRLEFEGITLTYDPVAHNLLSLDDLLGC